MKLTKFNIQNIKLILFFLIYLLMSSSIYAGNREGAVSFSLGAGYDFFSSKRHIDNAAFPFIGLGYQLSSRWGIEGTLGKFTTTSHHPVDQGKQVKGTFLLIDGIYHFAPYQLFEPYLLAGVGINSLNPNGTNANNEGNVNIGVGVQAFFDRSVALRLDARDVMTTMGGKHDILVNGGVVFLFDLC